MHLAVAIYFYNVDSTYQHMHTSGSAQQNIKTLSHKHISAHLSTVTLIKRPTDARARTTDHPAVDCPGRWRNLQLTEHLDEKDIKTM